MGFLSLRIFLFALISGTAIFSFVFFSGISGVYHTHLGTIIPPRPAYPPLRPPADHPSAPPPPPLDPAVQLLWTSRAESVRQAFLHAYEGYETHAPFPADELTPLTNGSVQNFNGWGVTMVDSLDTMLLLGFDDIFQRAVSQVAEIDFKMLPGRTAPFFETIIRYLGGLLSAYALSKEPILLSRAEDLATRLLPAFDTVSGIPVWGINTETQATRGGYSMCLAEIATCQMEFKYLAHLTGRMDYFTKVDRIMDLMIESQSRTHGMWPTYFSGNSGAPSNSQYSVGAFADSAYEYLLKQYLLSGKTEHRIADMYMKSMTGILENLLFLSHTRHLLYVTDTDGMVPSRKFEHLSCFFPGLLALGAATLPESVMSPEQKELHMWAAEGLAHTCWVMYADQPSGLGPDGVEFTAWPSGGESESWKQERWMHHVEAWQRDGRLGGKPPGVGNAGMPIRNIPGVNADYIVTGPNYLLRPETLESMYVMYRLTKDIKWRERGWQIWQAIESKTRTPSGYASIYSVTSVVLLHQDSMPSYFLAETIKYAYLLLIDTDPWPVEEYVFNTEAHPIPVFSWRDWERRSFGVES